MIPVTKMNGESIMLNADLIEMIEAHPDTIITLTSGNRLMVKENMDEMVEKVKEYKKEINIRALENISGINEEIE
ncbi:MAG: flagellar FlbD family protein [Elusimicrobiota bacterium]